MCQESISPSPSAVDAIVVAFQLFKWRDKIKLALLYISYLAEIKYNESMLKPLIVTFKDVGIF